MRSIAYAARREAQKALEISSCEHDWKETARELMPDHKTYLAKKCRECGAIKLRGAGRKSRAGGY